MKVKIKESFKEIEVIYKNKKFNINSLDNHIIDKINEVINLKENKTNLVITLEEEITIIYLLLVIGISTYYKNMKNSENNILDILNLNDKVSYKRDIYTYSGLTYIKDKEYIKLLSKSGMTTYILSENSYELSQYNGESTRINKSKKLQLNNKSNLTKILISQIMNEDISNLNGVVEQSNVIVINGKEKILEILQDIEIIVNNQAIPFTELFCSAYWSSSDGEPYIIKNSIKDDILLNITTNTSTALDLIMNDNRIKNVVVINERSYKDSLDTDIRRLSFLPDIKNIMLLDTWQSNDNYEFFMNEENDYRVTTINDESILDNVNLYEAREFKSDLLLQKKQYTMASNLLNKKIKVSYIEDSSSLNDNIKLSSNLLKQLCSYIDNSDDTLRFIKIAYSICNRIERTIVPLKYSENNREAILSNIKILQHIKQNFHETRSEHELMEKTIQKLTVVIDKLGYENKKFLKIKEISVGKSKILLCLKNKEEMQVVNKYLAINRINNIKATLIHKDIDYINYDVVILTFYQDNISIIKNNCIKELEIVCYGREFYKYKSLINKNISVLNLMSSSYEVEYSKLKDESIIECPNEFKNTIDEDTEIKEIIDKSFIRLITSKEYSFDNKQTNSSRLIAKKLAIFKDGSYTFLSENYSCNYITKSEDDIGCKNIDEIEIGDKLVFVKNDINGKGDIVKDTIEKLRRYKEFEDLYGEYFNRNMYWKNSLLKYMDKNNLDSKDIANRFRIHGQTITALAINNWLNGNIIGPQNSDNLKIIAEIVDDKQLKNEIETIITSCRQVRSIQIKVRKSIARMVIDSVISNDNNDNHIYQSIAKVIGNFKEYAYIGEIESIHEVNKEIGTQFINKINEGIEN